MVGLFKNLGTHGKINFKQSKQLNRGGETHEIIFATSQFNNPLQIGLNLNQKRRRQALNTSSLDFKNEKSGVGFR